MRVRYLPLILTLAPPTPAPAQRPVLVGTYVGASFSTPTDPRNGRVGASAVLPLFGPLDLYPSFEIFPDVGAWQGLLTVRLQPLGTEGFASTWYIGGGVALSAQAPRKALVTGLQWSSGRARPFLEMRFLGDIEEANPELDVVAGLSVRMGN